MPRDGIDGMARVETLRRFDDGWCRLVRGVLPRVDVYDRSAIFAESKIEDLAERSRVGSDRGMNSVGVRWREIMFGFNRFSGNQNGTIGTEWLASWKFFKSRP